MTKFTVTTPTEAAVSVTSDLMQVSDNGILFFYNTSDRNGGKQIVRAFASGHWNSVERNSPVVVRRSSVGKNKEAVSAKAGGHTAANS